MSQEAFSVFCVSAKQNSRLWGKNEKVKQKTKKFKGSLQFSDVKFFPHRGIIRHSLTKWEKKMFRKKNKEKSSTRKFCPNWTGPEVICIYSDYHLSHCSNVTFLNGPTPASFIVYFWSFQTNISTIFTSNICEKMSMNTVSGFEPTTFGTWVSSHNDLLFQFRLELCVKRTK